MKILLVGGGGREHALAWKLACSGRNPDIFCAPGNAGTAQLGMNLDIKAEDIAGLSEWAAREHPDLTVIGPEAPLCAGLADELHARGFSVFGPSRSAARIEGSKVFSKEILLAAGVPTGRSESFKDAGKALACIDSSGFPIVVKVDGLASGKGVFICSTREEAQAAVRSAMVDGDFGAAGANILIEEFLEGEEVSMMALVDGEHAVLLPSAQDHKRALDGDQGPNTGGMGAYSPAPMENPEFRGMVMRDIIIPTLNALRERGIKYQGVLYAGLIITSDGPKVLEFNCRFGDPETQVVLPRLDGDLIPALEACINGSLKDEHVKVRPEHCVCVVMTSVGYPGPYRKGDIITGLPDADAMKDIVVFHAGTDIVDGNIVTNGGRVLGVTALDSNTDLAAEKAYNAVSGIEFAGSHFRRDIAARGRRCSLNYDN